MSAPDIRKASKIVGKTALAYLDTSFGQVLTNPANSNNLLKVCIIRAANTGSTNAKINVALSRNGSSYYVAYEMLCAPNTSLIVIGQDEFLYLEEGDTLVASRSASGAQATIAVQYEQIAR